MSETIHFHWQNLNEDERGRPRGFPHHGRCWLRVLSTTFRLEWALWSRTFALELNTGGEGGALLVVAVPPIALYFGFAPKKSYLWPNRETGVRVFDWAIWWRLWCDAHSWSSQTPKWRDGRFRPLDVLLGKSKFSERIISEHEAAIPMPEGPYPAKIRLSERTWKRPRWFSKRIRSADVDLKTPIPHEGKGENSWDCGKDALHGLSAPAKNVEEAIAATVRAALGSRRKYDGNVMAVYPPPRHPEGEREP